MTSPAAVLALVLAMTAVGSSGLLWLAPTFGALRHGYEMLTGVSVALLAWAASASLSTPVSTLSGDAAASGSLARTLLLVSAGLTAAGVVALVAKLPSILARLLGIAATLAGLAAFVPLAAVRTDRGGAGGTVQGVIELTLGSVLMGAIWVGMILGHWYLVERRLSNRYMVWIAWANVGALVAGLASVLLSGRNPAPCEGLVEEAFERCALTFAPVLRIGSMTIILGLGVLALLALIAGFNVKLAKEGGRSIQASTGMFYLAVILAPAVEFAAKVRFF
ncbi:MAG: hypothetical protein JJT89_08395 [Nitriliruptoraceae bacterium]|nr:hypothetical protein [Nitriliruptoraceae bacterium]